MLIQITGAGVYDAFGTKLPIGLQTDQPTDLALSLVRCGKAIDLSGRATEAQNPIFSAFPIGFSNELTAVLPTGTTNDWSPTGWLPGTITKLNIQPGAAPVLNGLSMTRQKKGVPFVLINLDPAITIVMANLAAGSLPANQFFIPGGGQGSLPPQYGALCVWDGTNIKFPG